MFDILARGGKMKSVIKLCGFVIVLCTLFGCHNYEADKLDTLKQDKALLTPPCLEK